MMLRLLTLLLPGVILCSCQSEPSPPTRFQMMEETGIEFSNDIRNTKDFNIFTYRNFYNGGGVAIGDVDKDGLSDVFLTANMGPSKLFLNKGDWKFEEVTEKAGIPHRGKWATGVVMADINADGWLDIYVCYAGYQQGISQENELYINNHNGTFTESAKAYGLNETGYTTHAAFFDYDADGDLDCYILKNSFIPVNTLNYANKRELRAEDWPVADFLKGGGDKLLRNEGGRYVDVSKEAGIYGSLIGFGLGVTVGDVNGDLYPDIYISNDFFERDYLYINKQDGTFSEELEQRMQHISHSSMGADLADINNDGQGDLFVTEMLPDDDQRLKTTSSFEHIDVQRLKVQSGFYHQYMQNTLQLNDGSGQFREIGHYSGVAASDWSWGGLIFDADNDGQNDIYVCNGIYHDVTDQDFIDFFANDIIQNMVMTGKKDAVDEIINKMPSRPVPNKMFRNTGNLRFMDAGQDWGLGQPSFSNGAAYGDLDNDGDLDLVVNNVNSKAFVYRNNSRQQDGAHFISVQLEGKAPNAFAVGSILKVYANGKIMSRELIPSRGFQSSVDYRQVIGLGKAAVVDSLVVIWPDRTYTSITKPAIDTLHRLKQVGGSLYPPLPSTAPAYFASQSAPFEPHKEDEYVDFYYERNVPVMQSRQGPASAAADVNGDGLTDVFIGGAAGQAGHLYLQTASGYRAQRTPVFEQMADFEDVNALFFDGDGDGDADLVVGSGGNHQPAFHNDYYNRFYINDGKGNFTLSRFHLPSAGMNAGALAAADVDGDGDQDLFVGSRSIPQNYGLSPKSQLLRNEGGGRFTDATQALAPELLKAGMITAAHWADLTGDGRKDLVVTGEWMAPQVYTWNNGQLKKWKTSLDGLNGWWQSLAAADLDGDGDTDLVLGNTGENFYLRPDSTAPVRLFMQDFDRNQTVDKILTRTVNGRNKPVFLKKEMTEQIASIRKQNLKYADYADRSVEDLFTAESIGKSEVKTFSHAFSCVALNEGGGRFRIIRLPDMVQLSSVHAIQVTEVNGDGKADLVLAGNQFGFLPQFSRLDASYGHLLIGDGRGGFTWVPNRHSGFQVRGEVRAILPLNNAKGHQLLFLQNNDTPRLYRLNPKP